MGKYQYWSEKENRKGKPISIQVEKTVEEEGEKSNEELLHLMQCMANNAYEYWGGTIQEEMKRNDDNTPIVFLKYNDDAQFIAYSQKFIYILERISAWGDSKTELLAIARDPNTEQEPFKAGYE